MCEKNEDLQKAWKPKIGDWYVDFDGDIECVALMGELIIKHHTESDKWIPTQEQLQEMVLKIFSPFAKIIKLGDFVSNYVKLYKGSKYENLYWRDLYPTAIESMNEFWLMYVMHKKYNKIWTGQKWVKAE